MRLSSISCVICIAAIAVGQKAQHQHQHLNINQSTSEALVNKHDDHHNDHSGHEHEHRDDHHEDHNPDDIESSELDNPARDYVTWLAAAGKKHIEFWILLTTSFPQFRLDNSDLTMRGVRYPCCSNHAESPLPASHTGKSSNQ